MSVNWEWYFHLSATSKTEVESAVKHPCSPHTSWMFQAAPEEKVLNSVWARQRNSAHQLVNGKCMTYRNQRQDEISFEPCMPPRATEREKVPARWRWRSKREECEQIVQSCLLVLKEACCFEPRFKTQVETASVQICFVPVSSCVLKAASSSCADFIFSLSRLNEPFVLISIFLEHCWRTAN